MKKTIIVDEAIINEVQAANTSATVATDVIMQLLDMHKLDGDENLLQSVTFKAYQKEAEQKRITFEMAKQKMLSTVVPKEDLPKIKEWNCDYFTRELTYTI